MSVAPAGSQMASACARLALRSLASVASLTRNWMSFAPAPTSRATQAALSTMG